MVGRYLCSTNKADFAKAKSFSRCWDDAPYPDWIQDPNRTPSSPPSLTSSLSIGP